MLCELRVRQLGVIEDVTVVLGPGLTSLTGETGAGKTLLVDAVELLLGGPADTDLVRPGAAEALVEGRFIGSDDRETILARVVPAKGRSRAYIDGRMVSAAQLSEVGESLVDLHGQNAHQSLLSSSNQRAALDQSAAISTEAVAIARRRVRQIKEAQATLGGDARTRARELDLLRYQLDEMEKARLEDPGEDEALRDEEERLADAAGLREAAAAAWQALVEENGVLDSVGEIVSALAGRRALDDLHDRLQGIAADLTDLSSTARNFAESVEDDPDRLAAVGARRQALTDLRRKYGDTLAEVISYREQVRDRIAELESHDSRAASLDRDLAEAERALVAAEFELWSARRQAAPVLAAEVEARLHDLAMPRARFEVEVSEPPGQETVVWRIGANPGEPVLPLAKVASGGELARTMLAARLAVGPAATGPGVATDRPASAGPMTLIFDEVDAGIGGEAAAAVGRALATLAEEHQVLVVTHLPQVAAFGDRQLAVQKEVQHGRTVATVQEVQGHDRVIELSRMLSGSPDSETARLHATELLQRVQQQQPSK